MDRATLPALNAILNSCAACLLVAGWIAIRQRREALHKKLMLSATGVSTLFLISYLTHHARFGSTRFLAEGWIKPCYFAILLSHTLLAAALGPLVLITLARALRDDRVRHARLARWTLPIWLYVSVTGVVVYLLLYQLPGAQGPL